MRVPEAKGVHDFFKAFLQVSIDKDAVKVSRCLSVRKFLGCISQASLDLLLGFRSSSSKALLQILHAGRRNEDIKGLEGATLDQLNSLNVNVENADLSTLLNRFDRSNTRSVVLPVHFGVLDKLSLGNLFFDILNGCKVVVDTIFLSFTRPSRGVRNRKAKLRSLV
jgi:hypothetical protein